jgi:hypothetical protein
MGSMPQTGRDQINWLVIIIHQGARDHTIIPPAAMVLELNLKGDHPPRYSNPRSSLIVLMGIIEIALKILLQGSYSSSSSDYE